MMLQAPSHHPSARVSDAAAAGTVVSLTKRGIMAQPAVAATELFDEDFFQLASECSVEAWLDFLGHRWKALILYHLAQGPKRFGDVLECLPTLTPKVLTDRLIALERYGLVFRPTGARGEHYMLTEKGRQLGDILDRIELWSRDFPRIPEIR